VSWFARFAVREDPMTDEEEKDAFTTTFRKSFRASIRKSIDRARTEGRIN
jgi:hypothetical protein